MILYFLMSVSVFFSPAFAPVFSQSHETEALAALQNELEREVQYWSQADLSVLHSNTLYQMAQSTRLRLERLDRFFDVSHETYPILFSIWQLENEMRALMPTFQNSPWQSAFFAEFDRRMTNCQLLNRADCLEQLQR